MIVGSRVQPFGRKINDEYLMATEISSQHSSEWVRWLHHEYHGMLVREVLNRNRYDRDRVILESVVDFLSGKKNTVSFRF